MEPVGSWGITQGVGLGTLIRTSVKIGSFKISSFVIHLLRHHKTEWHIKVSNATLYSKALMPSAQSQHNSLLPSSDRCTLSQILLNRWRTFQRKSLWDMTTPPILFMICLALSLTLFLMRPAAFYDPYPHQCCSGRMSRHANRARGHTGGLPWQGI